MCWLTVWLCGKNCVHSALHIKGSNQHHLNLGPGHPRFLRPQRRRSLLLKTLALGLQIILKDPDSSAVITLSNRFGFKLFQDVMTHLHTPLLLLLFQQLQNHFCTDLPHPQIFCNDSPHLLAVHVQLICNHSNSQVVISMHLLTDKLDIFLSPACARPPAPGVIFHILLSLFKPPVPLASPSS